jgi:hypothetical protein
MFDDVVDSKEVTPHKGLPNMVMVVVVCPEIEINDIDSEPLYDDAADGVPN